MFSMFQAYTLTLNLGWLIHELLNELLKIKISIILIHLDLLLLGWTNVLDVYSMLLLNRYSVKNPCIIVEILSNSLIE